MLVVVVEVEAISEFIFCPAYNRQNGIKPSAFFRISNCWTVRIGDERSKKAEAEAEAVRFARLTSLNLIIPALPAFHLLFFFLFLLFLKLPIRISIFYFFFFSCPPSPFLISTPNFYSVFCVFFVKCFSLSSLPRLSASFRRLPLFSFILFAFPLHFFGWYSTDVGGDDSGDGNAFIVETSEAVAATVVTRTQRIEQTVILDSFSISFSFFLSVPENWDWDWAAAASTTATATAQLWTRKQSSGAKTQPSSEQPTHFALAAAAHSLTHSLSSRSAIRLHDFFLSFPIFFKSS